MLLDYRAEHTKCLENTEFQDFMADKQVQVMERFPLIRQQEAILRRFQNAPICGTALEVLLKRQGLMVRPEVLAEEAYPDGFTEYELESMDTVLNKAKRDYLGQDIFHRRGVGWGVGVRNLSLSPTELCLLYSLWLEFGETVERDKLLQGIYGVAEVSTRRNLTDSLLRLRKKIPRTSKLSVQTVGRANNIGESLHIGYRMSFSSRKVHGWSDV